MIEEPTYRGPFVVLAPNLRGYRVSVDPPPSPDPSRTFPEKNEAWAYARNLWTKLRCPLRNLCDPNTARQCDD